MDSKLEGNELFKQRKFDGAITKFTEAMEEDETIASTCWGNISACYFEMNQYQDCVDACTKALEINEAYDKVRLRRARANEKLDTWQSLEQCVEDMKKLDKDTSKIEPRLKAKQEEETAKMLGKLKDLGNGLLSNFGMSLDNFNMKQKDDGSYSINMQ